MDIPDPKPAQVIRYAYLWADEHATGRDEGTKDRPAAVVLVLERADGHARVAVVPITHSAPASATDAVEIPMAIKKHLGLDDERSWIVVTELNLFSWPGPDLRPAGAASLDTVLYGYLPSGFFRLVRDRLTANIRANRMTQVPRTQ